MNKKDLTVIYIILIIVIVPYLLFFINAFTGHWMNKYMTNVLWLLNLYFSTPGSFIIGIILLFQGKKIHFVLGMVSIISAIGYLGLLYWAIATGL